jgi:hypothetical protein
MGKKSRIKKEGKLKKMYKMVRQEKSGDYYTVSRKDGTSYKIYLNPLKHIMLLKKYKDPYAKNLMEETYRQYKAFIEQHKDALNKETVVSGESK